MKILVPSLEVAEKEGFSPEKDIFNRKPFGEGLLNLIENTSDELVLAIDAPWGEGKSTFIKMWRGLLQENDIQSINFDAFKNDYQHDPFLAIAGEIYHLIEDENEQSSFKEKSSKALKVVGRIGLRVGIKALTAGVLDETVLEGAGAGTEASKLVDDYVGSRLESVEQDKKSIDDFRIYLEKLAAKIGKGKPIVFIIDELDRCRPPFALEVLENIKHLFSVPNIIFVLSMNRVQIEESVRSEYGAKMDASKYLQKFVNLWAHLPKAKEQWGSDAKTYLKSCLTAMNFNISTPEQKTAVMLFEELVEHYNLSLREIERCLTNFAIMQNVHANKFESSEQKIGVYLSIIKVVYPSSFKKLASSNISYLELLKETKLTDFKSKQSARTPEGHQMKWVLFCSLSNDDEINVKKISSDFPDLNYVPRLNLAEVCKLMNAFQ